MAFFSVVHSCWFCGPSLSSWNEPLSSTWRTVAGHLLYIRDRSDVFGTLPPPYFFFLCTCSFEPPPFFHFLPFRCFQWPKLRARWTSIRLLRAAIKKSQNVQRRIVCKRRRVKKSLKKFRHQVRAEYRISNHHRICRKNVGKLLSKCVPQSTSFLKLFFTSF